MSQHSVYEILKNASKPLTADEIAASTEVTVTTARANIRCLRMRREVETIITKGGKSRYVIKSR